MLTRCPHCETTFRVSPEQLKVRQGKVRCGQCERVFNALEALTDEVAFIPTPVQHPGQPSEHPAETAEEQAAGQEIDFDLGEEESVEVPVESAANPIADAEAANGPEYPAVAASPAVAGEDVQDIPADLPPEVEAIPAAEDHAPSETGSTSLPEEWVQEAEATSPPSRWPWAIGAFLLLLVAAAQLLFQFRVELAVLLPEARPLLVAACEPLGCTVPFPRKPELVSIESSDLAPESDRLLSLTAVLKNRAVFAQEFPHLELTLTDARDTPVLRKILPPAGYLPAGKPAFIGFAAREEVAVKLELEVDGVPAAGYRLYLFYP